MRGSVTRLVKDMAYGFILGEDGCEVYFDRNSTNGVELASLSVGEWVEFSVASGSERPRAVNVRPVIGLRHSHH